MLSSWLAGTPFSKAEHRRALLPCLNGRSESSIGSKHAPRLYTLPGAIGASCALSAATFLARPK